MRSRAAERGEPTAAEDKGSAYPAPLSFVCWFHFFFPDWVEPMAVVCQVLLMAMRQCAEWGEGGERNGETRLKNCSKGTRLSLTNIHACLLSESEAAGITVHKTRAVVGRCHHSYSGIIPPKGSYPQTHLPYFTSHAAESITQARTRCAFVFQPDSNLLLAL